MRRDLARCVFGIDDAPPSVAGSMSCIDERAISHRGSARTNTSLRGHRKFVTGQLLPLQSGRQCRMRRVPVSGVEQQRATSSNSKERIGARVRL